MRTAALAAVTLLSACVPRAAYRATVAELEETRQLVMLQQVALTQLEAELERLEGARGPRRPAGPPPTTASSYSAMDLRLPELMSLPMHQQAAAMEVLNTAAAPCAPCKDAGQSVATCLVEQPACANMPGIARRVIGEARLGADATSIAQAIHYEQPWMPGVPSEGHARGPADAPVTIVMFMEAQCPYCVRAADTMSQLEERYGHRIRLVYKHMPLAFHDQARPAAIAMEAAAKQGRFWDYHDALYARAGELRSNPELLREVAVEAGLDMGAFDLEDPALAARVDADVAAAGALGVTGTPNFFVNGYPMRGAQPVDRFAALIDRELRD
jgi:predicted DsbA family dithiol-disulfide isomerase